MVTAADLLRALAVAAFVALVVAVALHYAIW
jgi:hypothetical protein